MSVSIDITPGNRNQVSLTQKPTGVTLAGSPSLSDIVPVPLLTQGSVLIGRLVADIGGRAVLYDVSNPAHAYALVGIAITSALDSTPVLVQPSGVVSIPGWGLTPGGRYRAGLSGQLITGAEASGAVFSQVIGRAVSENEFQLNVQSIIIH